MGENVTNCDKEPICKVWAVDVTHGAHFWVLGALYCAPRGLLGFSTVLLDVIRLLSLILSIQRAAEFFSESVEK